MLPGYSPETPRTFPDSMPFGSFPGPAEQFLLAEP